MDTINITSQNRNKLKNIENEITNIMNFANEIYRLKRMYEKNLIIFDANNKSYISHINKLINSYVEHTQHITKKSNYVLSTKMDNRWNLQTWEEKYKLTKVRNDIYYVQFEDEKCLFCEKIGSEIHFSPVYKNIFANEIKLLIENNDAYAKIINKKIKDIILKCNSLCKEIKQGEESLIERNKQDIIKKEEKFTKIELKKEDIRKKINELNKNLEVQENKIKSIENEKNILEREVVLKEKNIENICKIFESMVDNLSVYADN
jgi:hypothetical protein